jgi:ATP-dependent DNA helicase PIF1
MVITRLGRRYIKTQILGGSFHGQLRLIPRIKLTSTDGELPFIVSRRQFPIRLYFAITVNKSQGQSFNFVGINLRIPVFTHRQLYVALSRVTDIHRLSLLLPQGGNTATTTNIIYPEVLLPVTG